MPTNLATIVPQASRRVDQIARETPIIPHPIQARQAQQTMPGMAPSFQIDPPLYGYGTGPNNTIVRTLPKWRIALHNQRDWLHWAFMTLGLVGFMAWKARR